MADKVTPQVEVRECSEKAARAVATASAHQSLYASGFLAINPQIVRKKIDERWLFYLPYTASVVRKIVEEIAKHPEGAGGLIRDIEADSKAYIASLPSDFD